MVRGDETIERNKAIREFLSGHKHFSHRRHLSSRRHSPLRRHNKRRSDSRSLSRSRSVSPNRRRRRKGNYQSTSEEESDTDNPFEPIDALPGTKSAHMPSGEEPLKGPENYHSWCQHAKWLFKTNKVDQYVNGATPCPDPRLHPTSASNWEQNELSILVPYGKSL